MGNWSLHLFCVFDPLPVRAAATPAHASTTSDLQHLRPRFPLVACSGFSCSYRCQSNNIPLSIIYNFFGRVVLEVRVRVRHHT